MDVERAIDMLRGQTKRPLMLCIDVSGRNLSITTMILIRLSAKEAAIVG